MGRGVDFDAVLLRQSYKKRAYYKVLLLFVILILFVLVLNLKLATPPKLELHISDKFPHLNTLDFSNILKIRGTCTIPIKDSIVNVFHIVKSGDTYSISCEFRDLYSNLTYRTDENFPVFFGLVMDCTPEAARLIDRAVRTRDDCIFPMDSPLSGDITDYYGIYMACNKKAITDKSPRCASQILSGEYYSGLIFVIDSQNRFSW